MPLWTVISLYALFQSRSCALTLLCHIAGCARKLLVKFLLLRSVPWGLVEYSVHCFRVRYMSHCPHCEDLRNLKLLCE